MHANTYAHTSHAMRTACRMAKCSMTHQAMYLWALLRPCCQVKLHTWALAHEPEMHAMLSAAYRYLGNGICGLCADMHAMLSAAYLGIGA